jgi:alpha-L-rhamnosidase
MIRVLVTKWFFVILIFFHGNIYAQPLCAPIDLRCEYQSHPLVIDQQNPRLSWRLEDDRREALQTAYQIMVASDSVLLKNGKADLWNTGKIQSAQSNAVYYKGKPLISRQRYYWQVIVWDKDGKRSAPSAIGKWETGMFKLTDWKGSWINDGKDTAFEPAPYFIKHFDLHGKIRSARLYICGLGYYELHLNGQKVGNRVLDPGYTRFDKTNFYTAYDITSHLQQGKNAIGLILGNGWFNEQSRAVWYFHKAPWRARPQFLLNLFIEYADGHTQTIVTNDTWKVSTGSIVFNNIYSGEYQDNRLLQEGWDESEFDNSTWAKARLVSSPGGQLRGQLMPPIRIKKEIKPVSIKKFNDTTYLFDMGQNFAGWSRLTVSGKRGTVIHIKHGEVLYPDGRLNIQRISAHYRFVDTTEKAQTDQFILNGNGTEIFQQHFNYHGYQYVEITSSSPIKLSINSLTGLFMHTDVDEIGHFSCSDTLVNKIYTAGIWSYLSNLYGIPTDCPHREKNGWTGDGHIGAETGLYNFDGILLYEKWMRDFIDEQRESGELPGIIPTAGWGYQWGNGPAWDAAIMIVPWYIYLYYGDATLINKYYENYKRYVDYLTFRSQDYLVNIGLGDWTPYKTKTPVELTSSCYYYVDAYLLSFFAQLNGKTEDAAHYAKMAEKIKESVNKKYLDRKTMTYANGSQTALSAALYQQIVPDGLRDSIAENLAIAVKQNDSHLDVGLLGSKYLLNALSDNDYGDLAFTVASQRTKPSWGWWILQGMTTYQESWDLGPSRNHIMYGEIVAWMFKNLAGIQPDPKSPGFKHVILKPDFVNGLTHAEAEHENIYGVVRSSWKRTSDGIIYRIEIPANTSATIYVTGSKLYENSHLVNTNNQYVHLIKNEKGQMIYKVMAGKYDFKIK